MFVYGILCHRLTTSLIFTAKKLLESKESFLIIHIDKKTNINEFTKIKKTLATHQNIKFIEEDRVDVRWGHISQVEATLVLLKEANKINYKYFSLISGDDIPLSNNEKRELFLNKAYNEELEFIGNDPYYNVEKRIKYKYTAYHYIKDNSLKSKIFRKTSFLFVNLLQNKIIQNLPKLYYGTQWFTISKKSINYILNYLEKNENYLIYFKNSLCSDEIFFHTILYNSPFKEKIYKLNTGTNTSEMALRYINWTKGPDYPRTLDQTDFEDMKKSNALFARKINTKISIRELEDFINS